MNNKILAIAIAGVLIVAAIAGVIILTMVNTSGNDDQLGNTDDSGDDDTDLADERKANFVVASLDIGNHNVLAGIRTILTIGLTNNGTADGTLKLNITLDDSVVKSQSVFIGAGNSTTITYAISSPIVGNHTVAVGDRSTYLNCHDFYAVGTYMTYHSVEYDSVLGTMEYNYTFTYMAQNATTFTVNTVYEGDVYPSSTDTYNKSDSDQSNRENMKLVGMENVHTAYGEKRLAHYTYTFEYSGFHFEVDSYHDDKTGIVFKSVTRTEGFSLTEELIDTDREWVMEI